MSEGGDLVVLLPTLDAGISTVDVTVRGVTGRAAGFLTRQRVRIDDPGDPVLGGGELGPLHCGRYAITARFDGDAHRLPSTLTNSEVLPGDC